MKIKKEIKSFILYINIYNDLHKYIMSSYLKVIKLF